MRDVTHLLLLASVDYLYARWPAAHVPMLDRRTTFGIIAALNGTVVAHVWLARALPRWGAQRIARTWCLAERARFFQR